MQDCKIVWEDDNCYYQTDTERIFVTDNPAMTVSDISSESWREYLYMDGRSVTRIDHIPTPLLLLITPTGSHRIIYKLDGEYVIYYALAPGKKVGLRWGKANPLNTPLVKF